MRSAEYVCLITIKAPILGAIQEGLPFESCLGLNAFKLSGELILRSYLLQAGETDLDAIGVVRQ